MRGMRSALAAAVLIPCIAAGVAAAQTTHTHRHSFSDAEKWSHVFDDPERDAWQKPHAVIQALALKPDARVADLGAGTGYFSARLANMLPQGLVYAVDIEPDMVRYLEARAKRENLRNLTAVAGAPDDPRLPEKVDLILLVDVYHHIEDRARYFRKLSGSLRPGGRIAVIDFKLDSPEGPPRAVRIAPDVVRTEMKAAGYAAAAEHTFLPYQYFLVFRPAS
jgi:SAM-dependent methyltransferase